MKKLTIILLALFFIGSTNINAQTADTNTEIENTIEEIQEANKDCPFTKTADGKLICIKTGKICDPASCKNKSKCCKGKAKSKSKCCKSKSSCSKAKTKGFNYGNTNNYGSKSKSKCSGKKVKKCGSDCIKPCCTQAATEEAEQAPSEE